MPASPLFHPVTTTTTTVACFFLSSSRGEHELILGRGTSVEIPSFRSKRDFYDLNLPGARGTLRTGLPGGASGRLSAGTPWLRRGLVLGTARARARAQPASCCKN